MRLITHIFASALAVPLVSIFIYVYAKNFIVCDAVKNDYEITIIDKIKINVDKEESCKPLANSIEEIKMVVELFINKG